jgi:hypothetical protein
VLLIAEEVLALTVVIAAQILVLAAVVLHVNMDVLQLALVVVAEDAQAVALEDVKLVALVALVVEVAALVALVVEVVVQILAQADVRLDVMILVKELVKILVLTLVPLALELVKINAIMDVHQLHSLKLMLD